MALSLVGKQIGNYKITKQLGEGGMGAVYLGEHPLIGKKVAVKVLHDELAQKADIVSRFFTEAKAVNDIGHENIVDIVDFGQMKDDGGNDVVYFIMEFLEGDSLNDRLKRGTLAPEKAVHIIMQCASALAASHAKGIVHRDLKPDNIYLVKRGSDDSFVKLLDFGIAKLTGDAGASGNKTRAGSVLGTPAYMSPEQCDGRGNIDHRSDIYSLGMVLYELLTGRVAFTGEGFGEILVAQITLPAPPPTTINPNIPHDLEAIVMRCLEKDRETRFQNMDELKVALEGVGGRRVTGLNKVIDESPFDAPTVIGANSPAPGQPRPTTLSGSASEAQVMPQASGGSKAPLFVGLFLLVAGGGGGAYYFIGMKDAKPQPAVVTPQLPVVNPPPAAPTTIKVTIDSTPRGADIVRAGITEPIGKTPLDLTMKKGEPSFDVLLQLDGFKPATRTIASDSDHQYLVALEKAEAPPAPTAPTPPTPVAKSGGEKHGHKLPKPPGEDTGMKLLPDNDKPANRNADPDGVLAPKL